MVEGATFSALIDEAVLRSGRRNRRNDIISYARTTIRECLVKENFYRSLVELEVQTTSEPFVWKRPQRLRILVAVQYPYYTAHGNPIFPKERAPGEVKNEDEFYFYQSGESYVFNGVAANSTLKIAYLEYLKRLAYYENEEDRPARFDIETETWTYHADYASTEEQQEVARGLVTNWLLFDWYDLILEGTLAKIFKSVGDARNQLAYSTYKSLQKDLSLAEGKVILNSYV